MSLNLNFYLPILKVWRATHNMLNCRRTYSSSIQLSKEKKHEKILVQSNADVFGTHAIEALNADFVKQDPEDVAEKLRQKLMDRRRPREYIDMVKNLLKNHEFQNAKELLEHRMLKIDRVKPDSYIYDLLISYCGRTGNVKDAFHFYNQIKKRGYFVNGGQYTSIFNACANSLNSTYALEVAEKVRNYLQKDPCHRPNIKNYNAMIKAFGRHGDLRSALEIVDEMIEKRRRVLSDTYSFLLQACISDRNTGFRHALLLWHKLLINKTDPDIYLFNSLLRCIRDCSVGNLEEFKNVIQYIITDKRPRSFRQLQLVQKEPGSISNLLMISAKSEKENLSALQLNSNRANLKGEVETGLPDLLSLNPNMGSCLDFNSFTTAYHRLQLCGGVLGFLNTMKLANVQPDIKSFTMLLEIIPSTTEFEEELMAVANNMNVSLDIGFCNVLIKRRSLRYDDEAARNVLTVVQQNALTPDLITFGVLALGCRTRELGERLINEIEVAGYRPNSEILGPMVKFAILKNDSKYFKLVLRVLKEYNVQPSAKIMTLIKDYMDKNPVKNAKKLC